MKKRKGQAGGFAPRLAPYLWFKGSCLLSAGSQLRGNAIYFAGSGHGVHERTVDVDEEAEAAALLDAEAELDDDARAGGERGGQGERAGRAARVQAAAQVHEQS